MPSELKKKTAKGLAWGGLFSLFQQLLSFLLAIVIARRLSPSDYGMVGVLAVFTALATILQEGGLVFVLTNRKGISDIEYSTVFWFNVLVSSFSYVILFVTAPLISAYFGIDELISLSRFVFVGFFISSFGVVQSAVLYKEMRVRERGLATFIGTIIAGIVGIILAYNGFAYWGLATQTVVSTFATTLMLWYFSSFRPSLNIDFEFLKTVIPIGAKYILPNIASMVGTNIYSLILGKFYSVKDVGFYSQAVKFEEHGYSFTLGVIRNVSQPMLVQVKEDNGQFLNAFRKLVRLTALISIPLMLILALIAPELIVLMLTPKWYFSGVILRLLCIGGAFVGLTTLASYLFISVDKPTLYMWLGILCSVIKIVFALMASIGGVISLAFMCVMVDLLSFVIYYYYAYKCIGYTINMLCDDLVKLFCLTFFVILISYFSTSLIGNIICRLIVRLFVSSILLILLINYIKYDVFEEAKDIIIDKIKIYLK